MSTKFPVMKIKITIKSALYDYATALAVLEESTVRDLPLNTIPIVGLLLREINVMAGVLFIRKSLNPSPEKVLDVLIARDRVRLAISENSQISRQTLLTISQLDKSFKQLMLHTRELKDIATWRDILSPPKEAWWWFQEAPHAGPAWSRLDWLWEALTLVMVIVNFSLVTEFVTRFLKGGLDPLGAFAIITQSLLAALAAGGTLTTTGRNFIERAIETLHIPQHFQHKVKLALAVLVFFFLLSLNASLPYIAHVYVQRGLTEQQEYQFASALDNYRRATELDPNNMKAHYLLGNSYEQLQQLKKARSAYQVAVLGNVTEAFNNLAHLYIVQDKDYSAAAALLRQGLQQNPADDQIRSILLKNLGWARLGQKRYSEAEAHLKEAIHLNSQRASAHCLLAQVLEAQGKKALALKSWQNCSNYAHGYNPDEDTWFGLAQQRLNSGDLSGN